MDHLKTLNVRVLSATRIFPDVAVEEERHVPLSIIDATVLRFSPTCACWIYDLPKGGALSTDLLAQSLRKALSWYPQWSGQLHWAKYDVNGGHTQRYGRLMISYGCQSDPGVEFVVANSPHKLDSFIPATADRFAEKGYWNAGNVPTVDLLPYAQLALYNAVDYEGFPCAMVQLTKFACGGLSVALKLAHPLADAQTMVQFVHNWASINRALFHGAPPPKLDCVFDPQILDAAAAGDINSSKADPTISSVARALPMNRFDWWASIEGCPSWGLDAVRIPPTLRESVGVTPLGPPLPWAEWDMAASAGKWLVYFSASEVHRMWQDASRAGRVSHLDALLAHVWALVNRARGPDLGGEVFLDYTFDMRRRLSPPLPEGFVGSPIMLARIAADASEHSIGKLANTIRTTAAHFNSSTLPALLHDLAHELSSQRRWDGFLGRRHAIVTSWVRLDVYDVIFGAGAPPRYVEATMPMVDGCIQIMEAGPSRIDRGKSANWWDSGVIVSLNLAANTLEKLVADQLLRKYSDAA